MVDLSGAFVDWLTIRERNCGQFLPLNDGCVIRLDRDGEVVYTTELSMPVVGSHSSSARVRVTDREVEVHFNPSRWNRAENVFGCDFALALTRANGLLASLDRPELTPGVCCRRADGCLFYTGSVLTRVDVAVCVQTGSALALEDYMWHVSGMCLPRVKTRRERNTVYFGGDARKRIVKVYRKHVELLAKQVDTSDDPEYVRAVADFCRTFGFARLEVRYGRDWLRANGMRATGHVSHERLVSQFAKDVEPMLKELEKLDLSLLTTSELGVLSMYFNGFDVRERLSRSAFYRRRKRIKEVTGYDIANDNVTRLEVKPRVIELQAAEPPDWYRMPEEA